MPITSTAVTINRVCISGMEAVISGVAMIKAGFVDVILAGGVEHMSGVPYAVPSARWGARLQNQSLDDMMIEALYCGSRLQPGMEHGPAKEGPIVDMFQGQALHHGAHGGAYCPDVQHKPPGDGRGGPQEP